MSESNSIKNWTEDERPREKMLQKGAAALADAELLAILIGSGTPKRSAVDLARDILALANNNLRELGRLSIPELQKVKGIGEARGITIAAAMELGRRRQVSEGLDRPAVHSSKDAAAIIVPLLQDLNHEVFCVLYLNHASKVLRHEMISSGGSTATVVDVRMILKNCLLYNANQIVVAHNHPSGNKKASESDKHLTRKIIDAAALMDIKLLDHVIVAGHEYLSMADEGLF
ncbi:MAG: DNA repair protein RadC [Bacteroidota bacterium]